MKIGRLNATAAAVLAVTLVGCVFSPQSARQATSGVPPQRIAITAQQWQFTPNEIHVKVNTPVQLVVTSADVDHGIDFTDLDVPIERVPAGRTVTINFIPNKAGTYHFQCAVVCGTGHDQMKGVLVAE